MYEYTLIRSTRRSIAMSVKDGKLIVRAPLTATREEIDDVLKHHGQWIAKHLSLQEKARDIEPLTPEELKALADRAVRELPELIDRYAGLLHVTVNKITVRAQHTKWGSCTSAGNLSLNVLIMLMPPKVRDAVIVHELCHRKEMNHSKRFYDLLYSICPDYEESRKWLNENGAALMARLK